MSLLINLMQPCWIKVLISLKKLFLTTKFWTIVYLKVYKDALKADIIYKVKFECGSYVKQI